MNNINTDEVPWVIENKGWYILSIFCPRENWIALIRQIDIFYQERQDKFRACLISFSDLKGQQIEIILSTPLYQENFRAEINQYFQLFLKRQPAIKTESFPYGKTVWCNYPKNTILWKRFSTKNFSEQYVNFHQTTFRLLLQLIEEDVSIDALFSAGLFLIVKGLTCINVENRKTIVSESLFETNNYSEFFSHADFINELIVENINLQEILEIVNVYLNEADSETDGLKKWLIETESLLKYHSFNHFTYFICKILGLNGSYNMMLLKLVNSYFEETE